MLWQRDAWLCCLSLALMTVWGATISMAADDKDGQKQSKRQGLELFEKKIRPVLIEHCYQCHASDSDDVGGNLLLDTREGLLAGGDSGASVTPGKPAESLLLQAIEYRDLEMPPDEKLPDSVAADFRRWIALGAPDPRKSKGSPKSESTHEPNEVIPLWSLQPVRKVAVPASDEAWPRTEIDQFIHDRLSANHIRPNPDADPAILLRRLHFDLTGLPPTPEQVADFTANPSPEQYAAVVDSLLASRAFGERWARHWLDVARYGESAGSSRDVLMLYAWRYRDYVIDALCRDIPYDRFITEQIAGDLMDATSQEERKRLQIATGLLAIGSKSLNGGNLTYDVIDDQIDVISKSVLGLTVSCARCHDHKFDPIPTADYYAMAGIFLSTDTRYGGSINRPTDAKSRAQVYLSLENPLAAEEQADRTQIENEYATLTKQVQSSKKRVASLRGSVPEEFRDDLTLDIPKELDAASQQTIRQYQAAVRVLSQRETMLGQVKQRYDSLPQPEYAIGVQEAKQISDSNILVRGEKNQQGQIAPRGFLSSVALGDPASQASIESIDDTQSGRRQLAQWLTHPDHPLTPRVAVNRIWQHLMGQGLVETVDNFGMSGLPPSHPELLDYLAGEFVSRHGWSQKSLIREIVLSRTYQLASHRSSEAYAIDPDNRLRWRMDRRRLEAEPLRDAMMSVSGLLRREPLQGSLVMQIGEGEVGRNINTSVLEQPFDYRSVYLPIIRGIIPEELKLFDFPEPSNVQGKRDSNTTPKQSLFYMNSPTVIRAAEHFASQLTTDASLSSDRDRIQMAYLRCFGRQATPDQVDQAVQFIQEMSADQQHDQAAADAWTTFCQTLIASAPFRFVD